MRVFLVDDHSLFRSGLRFLLSGLQDNMEFVEAENAESVINYEDKADIDLILLDLYLPGVEGFDALTSIKQHYHCSIVVLSSEDHPNVIRNAITQGAAGFIPKSSSPEVLMAALRLVLANGIYLPPHVLIDHGESQGADTKNERREAIISQLTNRQLGVLRKATQGKSNKVIARELNIADGTVKAHLSACYRVLEVANRTEAVYIAVSISLYPK